ncbi:hypothetical protein [Paenibacillus sp. ISL-20]|uniref:hypothetical protein n=1 Tax=Paenibacillus sp. ISL-20 TaxID=2819163 RepID=UPI001BE7C8B4|nr:hypothetical protein [Paenibacillus sp. ISL-20]MBT2759988.1 hypothetical protein [Paenibacillus sp. ISL-20]
MSKHVLDLLYETKGMVVPQFEDWLKDITDDELESLNSMAYSLVKCIKQEKENRENGLESLDNPDLLEGVNI